MVWPGRQLETNHGHLMEESTDNGVAVVQGGSGRFSYRQRNNFKGIALHAVTGSPGGPVEGRTKIAAYCA